MRSPAPACRSTSATLQPAAEPCQFLVRGPVANRRGACVDRGGTVRQPLLVVQGDWVKQARSWHCPDVACFTRLAWAQCWVVGAGGRRGCGGFCRRLAVQGISTGWFEWSG